MNNINYNLEMEKIIDKIDILNPKTLLLHSCCGPCSSAVLERLNKYFKITILYYNPNLDSEEEFTRRAREQKSLIEKIPKNNEINFLNLGYNNEEYREKIMGYEDEKEGGYRCKLCFDLRLEETAKLAKKLNFDYFTTTLSISPHKNSALLNKIGAEMSKKYDVKYLFSDFKKKDGYRRSVQLSKEYDMYRQDYCGCEYSKRESETRNKQ
ncbi:epoxyqueuosine reductase QueH [Anaerosphaera multitolerans]|uniref:Epoxyqueuosine reductase QueH n=1 Tax=Anaerosphaera multitolerans TaxID=2487351 RepID=A0A437S4W6_9FIRM|nr:epoxyqueuosine reductase QueH [Anaerosphaera multitolerans]RVU54040.1 recombinase [Anaerosphaera multitolerans]